MKAGQMKHGGKYNFVNQPERLIYIGKNFSGNNNRNYYEVVVIWNLEE